MLHHIYGNCQGKTTGDFSVTPPNVIYHVLTKRNKHQEIFKHKEEFLKYRQLLLAHKERYGLRAIDQEKRGPKQLLEILPHCNLIDGESTV